MTSIAEHPFQNTGIYGIIREKISRVSRVSLKRCTSTSRAAVCTKRLSQLNVTTHFTRLFIVMFQHDRDQARLKDKSKVPRNGSRHQIHRKQADGGQMYLTKTASNYISMCVFGGIFVSWRGKPIMQASLYHFLVTQCIPTYWKFLQALKSLHSL